MSRTKPIEFIPFHCDWLYRVPTTRPSSRYTFGGRRTNDRAPRDSRDANHIHRIVNTQHNCMRHDSYRRLNAQMNFDEYQFLSIPINANEVKNIRHEFSNIEFIFCWITSVVNNSSMSHSLFRRRNSNACSLCWCCLVRRHRCKPAARVTSCICVVHRRLWECRERERKKWPPYCVNFVFDFVYLLFREKVMRARTRNK